MGRIIEDFENVELADGEYLYGRTRDNDGSGNGTPVKEDTMGDIFQLMARMFRKAGVVNNGLPDNEYNGWQHFEAFVKYLRKYGEHYRYVNGGSPLVLTPVDVRRNVHIQIDGAGSGGIIGLPDLSDPDLEHLDTVTVSNYSNNSADVNTFSSGQFIGGYGTSSLSKTVASMRSLELILVDNGVVRFWLIAKYFTVA